MFVELSQGYPFSLAMLKKCRTLYEQAGLVTSWAEPSEDAPFHSLLVRFDKVGGRESSVTPPFGRSRLGRSVLVTDFYHYNGKYFFRCRR